MSKQSGVLAKKITINQKTVVLAYVIESIYVIYRKEQDMDECDTNKFIAKWIKDHKSKCEKYLKEHPRLREGKWVVQIIPV